MNEIILYGGIYSWSAESFAKSLGTATGDITVRLSSNGGDPEIGFAMISLFNDYPKGKSIKVDGVARSMGFFFLCYTDDVEAIDVSDFVVHRAAYPEWVENNPEMFTEARKSSLERVNGHLRAAMEAKIDVAKFEKITGKTLDEIFSLESRIDVSLTADQAKEIELINSIVKITPEKKKQIEASMRSVLQMSAEFEGFDMTSFQNTNQNPENKSQKTIIMTLAEFKAAHPEMFAQAVQEGITSERDRVGSLLAYHDVDPTQIKKMIKEGTSLTATITAELNVKMHSPEALKELAAANAAELDTDNPDGKNDPEKGAQTEAEKIEAEVLTGLGVNK